MIYLNFKDRLFKIFPLRLKVYKHLRTIIILNWLMFRKALKVSKYLFLVNLYQVQQTFVEMNMVFYILFMIKIIRIENLDLEMKKYLLKKIKNLRWMKNMDSKILKFLFILLVVITLQKEKPHQLQAHQLYLIRNLLKVISILMQLF